MHASGTWARRLAPTTGIWLTFARTKILQNSLLRVPSSIRATSSLRDDEQTRLGTVNFSFRSSVAELCFLLRNVAAISGGADKKIISKETKNLSLRNKHHDKLFCLGWGA